MRTAVVETSRTVHPVALVCLGQERSRIGNVRIVAAVSFSLRVEPDGLYSGAYSCPLLGSVTQLFRNSADLGVFLGGFQASIHAMKHWESVYQTTCSHGWVKCYSGWEQIRQQVRRARAPFGHRLTIAPAE